VEREEDHKGGRHDAYRLKAGMNRKGLIPATSLCYTKENGLPDDTGLCGGKEFEAG
jgi:hypothetical protein